MNYFKKEAVIKGVSDEYRYSLTRIWDYTKDIITIIMLNPSKANALVDDNTIKKCVALSKYNNFGGFEVVNIFAFRTTYPKVLINYNKDVLIGSENEDYILASIKRTKKIVLGWGNSVKELKNIKNFKRDREIAELLGKKGYDLYCTKLTKKGCPGHPLYISGQTAFLKIKWDGKKFI